MKKILTLLWLLNLWDALATWYAVEVAKFAVEWNSTMAWAIRQGAPVFFGLKVGAMTLIVYTINKLHKGVGVFPVTLATFAYAVIGVWHLHALWNWR